MKHNTLEPSEQDESLAPLFLSQKGSCQYINTRWSIWIYIYIPQQICDTHFSGCIIHGCLQFRTICCQLVMFRSLDAGQYNPPWTLGFFLMLNIIDWPCLTLQQKTKRNIPMATYTSDFWSKVGTSSWALWAEAVNHKRRRLQPFWAGV